MLGMAHVQIIQNLRQFKDEYFKMVYSTWVNAGRIWTDCVKGHISDPWYFTVHFYAQVHNLLSWNIHNH